MRLWMMFFVSMSLAACASREIRCDGRLTAINPPHGAVVQRDASGTHP
jgi:hypothetical protein